MKKILTVLLIGLMLASTASANQTRTTLIASTTLDADPTSATGTIGIQDAEKVAFFVTYDETEVGGGLSVAVTCDIPYDGTTWLDASFYDYAGGSTLQTSETLSSDGNYYFWFNPDLAVPQVRVVLTATGSDADDTADVACYIVQNK